MSSLSLHLPAGEAGGCRDYGLRKEGVACTGLLGTVLQEKRRPRRPQDMECDCIGERRQDQDPPCLCQEPLLSISSALLAFLQCAVVTTPLLWWPSHRLPYNFGTLFITMFFTLTLIVKNTVLKY